MDRILEKVRYPISKSAYPCPQSLSFAKKGLFFIPISVDLLIGYKLSRISWIFGLVWTRDRSEERNDMDWLDVM